MTKQREKKQGFKVGYKLLLGFVVFLCIGGAFYGVSENPGQIVPSRAQEPAGVVVDETEEADEPAILGSMAPSDRATEEFLAVVMPDVEDEVKHSIQQFSGDVAAARTTEGEVVTATATAGRCERYRWMVEQTAEHYPLDVDVVLAVMAQESACIPSIVSHDGSVGLMQVVIREWTATAQEMKNARVSIEWGMYFLYSALYHDEHNPNRDMWLALAAYNCGWETLNKDECLSFGGPAYADRVLEFWLPYFQE